MSIWILIGIVSVALSLIAYGLFSKDEEKKSERAHGNFDVHDAHRADLSSDDRIDAEKKVRTALDKVQEGAMRNRVKQKLDESSRENQNLENDLFISEMRNQQELRDGEIALTKEQAEKFSREYAETSYGNLIPAAAAFTKSGKMRIDFNTIYYLKSKLRPIITPQGDVRVIDLLTLQEHIGLLVEKNIPFLYVDPDTGAHKVFKKEDLEKFTINKSFDEIIDDSKKLSQLQELVKAKYMPAFQENEKLKNMLSEKSESSDESEKLKTEIAHLKKELQQSKESSIELAKKTKNKLLEQKERIAELESMLEQQDKEPLKQKPEQVSVEKTKPETIKQKENRPRKINVGSGDSSQEKKDDEKIKKEEFSKSNKNESRAITAKPKNKFQEFLKEFQIKISNDNKDELKKSLGYFLTTQGSKEGEVVYHFFADDFISKVAKYMGNRYEPCDIRLKPSEKLFFSDLSVSSYKGDTYHLILKSDEDVDSDIEFIQTKFTKKPESDIAIKYNDVVNSSTVFSIENISNGFE